MPKIITKDQWEQRIKDAGSGRYEFVRWAVNGEFGSLKKCVVRCSVDRFEWSSSASHLVNGGKGCQQCAGNRRWTAEDRIEQINKLEGIEFVSWIDEYKNAFSKANVRCSVDNYVWSARVGNLVNHGNGCPRCAKTGYDKSKTGTLYSLRSECGQYVKVGISNEPRLRYKILERKTPFSFIVFEQASGDGAKIAELEKHFHSKYERAGFTGFDGCTEWLIFTPQLLEELRELEDVE